MEDLKFIALDRLMGQVGELMAEIAARKSLGPVVGPPSSKKQRLRETDPW